MRSLARFLNKNKGVIHIGANTGQEAEVYRDIGISVIWVEAIPKLAEACENSLKGNFKNQRVINYLVLDKDDELHDFNIASNNGLSSSILQLQDHKLTHPKIFYTHQVQLKSKTLDSIIKKEGIDSSYYATLVMDTQGSELSILQGAAGYLRTCESIILETPNFEAYKNCPTVKDFDEFLSIRGFKKENQHKINTWEGGREYYDIFYKRQTF